VESEKVTGALPEDPDDIGAFYAYKAQAKAPVAPAPEVPALSIGNAQTPADDVGAFYQQKRAGALHTNLAGAASTTPDAHQKAVDDGKVLDIPADVAARNRTETEKQARIQRYRVALDDAPKMAALLAEDPDLAKISADDLPVLAKAESTFGKILSAFYGVNADQGAVLADVGRSVPQGSLEAIGGGMKGIADLNDVIGRTIERGIRAVGFDTAADVLTDPVLPWWLNPSGILRQPGLALKDLGETVGPEEGRQNLATDIGKGFGQVAGQIATALLTGGTTSTAMMFGQGADILAERVDEAGKAGTAEGDAAIVMGASVTALTEKLGLDALLHRVPPAIRNGILRTLTDIGIGGGIEAVQEVTEGILHNLVELVTVNPDAKLLEGLDRDALAAGGTGSLIRALVNAATKGRQISDNTKKEMRAGQDAATVEALVAGTAESKLRDRNPDAFSRVMAAQTQGTPVETFYVPATAIAELYQSGAGTFDDDPLNQIDGLREQYQEALAVGGDVEISAADYLTHIAPTDLHGRLKNDLRASRDGWSVNDAKQYAENPDREADLASLVERLALQDEGAAAGQTVFDDVYKQLMDTGKYESHQAAAQATLARDKAIARAARRGLGEDPDALYLRDQLRISGPGALARVRRGDLDLVIARLKSGETVTADKTPVLDIVRKAGGVKPGSNLAGELQHMGITSRTHPGLFRKTGIGDVDNFVLSEHDVLRDNGVPDSGSGYADREAVLEALRREAGGRGAAMLTQDERQQQTRLDEPVAVLIEQMEAAGLDPNAMTAEEIKAWATGQQATDTAPADGQGVLLQPVNPDVDLDQPIPVISVDRESFGRPSDDKKRVYARDRDTVTAGVIRNADQGWDLSLNKKDFKHGLSSYYKSIRDTGEEDAGGAHVDAGRVIRSLVENAVLVESHPDHKGDPRVLQVHDMFAAVRVGGDLYAVKLVVEEFDKGNKRVTFEDIRRVHDYFLPKRVSAPSGAELPGAAPSVSATGSIEAARAKGAPITDAIILRDLLAGLKDDQGQPYFQTGGSGELFQSVYHGSPHIFDAFSTAAIGSGEGAQVYGFGLYFAGKKEIAQYYRSVLAKPARYLVDGVDAEALGPGAAALAKRIAEGRLTLNDHLSTVEKESQAWVDAADSDAERARRQRLSDERIAAARSLVGKTITKEGGGRLYTVEIPDDGEYLLYDKPLSEQPEAVRKALGDLLQRLKKSGGLQAKKIPDDPTGAELYKAMQSPFAAKAFGYTDWGGSGRGVSEYLLSLGVRGIKYLDASARDSSGDSFNYVVFADSDAVIQAYEQSAAGGARGSFLPKRAQDPHSDPANIIKLTQNADLSTFLHESSHFYLFQLIDDAADVDVPKEARAKLQADLQTILDHVGVKVDVATATADQIHAVMTRDAHELWARSFEVYLREGKAPSASLRDAFASFAAWLTRIYKTLKAIPDYRKNLTPEVRGVMDRLLATDEAIKDAQNASSFRVPSALRSVMTAAEQRSLERLTEQANREATEDLRKRVMREMERERLEWWKEERVKVRAEVERDVRSRPVYRAYNIIRTGQTADGGQLVDENGEPRAMKLDRKTLERDYGKDVIKLLPKGLTTKDGASHHVVAGLTGFGSADELRDEMMNFRPMKEVVEEETDATMRQRHGDMLSDGRLAEDAAKVVLNEKQLELAALQAKALRRLASSVVKKAAGRLASEQGVQSRADDAAAVGEAQRDVEAVANAGAPAEAVAGLQVEQAFTEAFQGEAVGVRRAQGAALRQVRSIQTGLDLKAIQAAAKRAIAGKRLEDAQPGKYRAQADRLGRQIEEAIAARDYETAATLKEQQLINLALAREAQEAQARVEKAVKRFARLNKPDSKLAKTQNIDFVGAARAILSAFGLSSPQVGFEQQVWLQRLKEDSPGDEVIVRDLIDSATANAGTVAARGRTRTRQPRPGGQPVAQGQVWRQMTVAEFDSLTETVDGVLHMGRESRTAEIDGERVEMTQVIGDLNAQASSRDTGKRIGQTSKATDAEKTARRFWGAAAFLERVETWARRMDDGKVGPFTRTFVRPVLAAIYEYREAKQDKLKRLIDILEPRKADLLGKPIFSADLNYKFANKAELLHAILHTGNESNMRKLLLGGRGKGYAWGRAMPDGSVDRSRWDNMIRGFVQDGTLTKADYDTAQQIWDLLEELKGPAQIAHRKMWGFYFKEVEIVPIQTPFGQYRGGYVPAVTEKLLNADRGAQIDADALGQVNTSALFPAVPPGFTKSRVENYTQPLELNLMKLTGHVDQALKLTHLIPAVRQAARIARHRDFKEAMFGIDPHAVDDLLAPWLQRVVRQTIEVPYTAEVERTAGVALSWLRKNAAMQAMVGNILNAAQQITGLSSGMVRVKPQAVLRGLVASVKAPRQSTQTICQKSAFMRDRMANTTHDLMGNLDTLLEDKSALEKVQDKALKHGYFAQVIAQNFVDKAVWLGAYEQGLAKGMTEDEAVQDADSVIRTTQGSFNPEDASNAEARGALGRLFVMFYSYFNTQLNLIRSEAEIAVRESGWVGASPRLFYVFLMGAYLPAVLAEAIIQAARGELGDDDDDGLLDDVGELFGLSVLRFFAGMIPLGSSALNVGINKLRDDPKPYDDRLSFSPVFGQVDRVAKGVGNVIDFATTGEGSVSRAVKDALYILGTVFGLPLGQLGKPAGYIADVLEGEQEGEDLGDWARGLLSGREAPRQ
jgi:hypothetical protein